METRVAASTVNGNFEWARNVVSRFASRLMAISMLLWRRLSHMDCRLSVFGCQVDILSMNITDIMALERSCRKVWYLASPK
jgi:hypothetical protein